MWARHGPHPTALLHCDQIRSDPGAVRLGNGARIDRRSRPDPASHRGHPPTRRGPPSGPAAAFYEVLAGIGELIAAT